MNIITTPMCEDILKIAGVDDYTVVKPSYIENADVAVVLSETKTDIPKIPVKLNTYQQIYDSIFIIKNKFNTNIDEEKIKLIKYLINANNKKKDNRKNIKVKVYGNFLKDTITDMGYNISDSDYDFIIVPDYMNIEFKNKKNVIIIPSHKNVPKNIIQRIKERYELLESKLCMKQ